MCTAVFEDRTNRIRSETAVISTVVSTVSRYLRIESGNDRSLLYKTYKLKVQLKK